MKHQKRNIAIVGAALAFTLALASGADAGIEARQRRQQARISHGVATGELTRCEASRLEWGAARIERQERLMRRSGGGLGPRERIYLDHRLDRLSARIYREKHDPQRRR